ncbi:MAG: hypothetical protein AAF108_04705 [Planctomycetota bacterium]
MHPLRLFQTPKNERAGQLARGKLDVEHPSTARHPAPTRRVYHERTHQHAVASAGRQVDELCSVGLGDSV